MKNKHVGGDSPSSARQPSIAPPSVAPQAYYADGHTWEQSIARKGRASRALAWTVAAFSTLIAAGAIGTLIMALPLKKYEPYMIVVDRSTGFVEVKRPVAEGVLSQNEAVTMFNVVRYVNARETYDPRALKDNYDLAQVLSTSVASQDLTDMFSPANPKNPIQVLGRQATVAVNIKSVTFPNDHTALVRFSTDEKTSTNVTTRNWQSLIRFKYTSTPATNELRFQNPLGFQVTEYRRDQETLIGSEKATTPVPVPAEVKAP